ncbi:dihydroorotate dehydrogenase-like protein [Micropruina sonneratiae]|uniref:dihydroorotate dehydrogenase-like protein n=1 Tax=Micropruina sonneratiae TaxID=2986940 RepID=UPI0022263FE5|nr:dihydroorotate dehydrogenase-like protein [Micropruina sp. KQZ13P-5]MCW3159057.1 dihydroorotate dehydrogenase-like protein [Micropruina sp. KQZ13P-5]
MDLHTDYLGLALRSPLVASAGPLSTGVDGVRELAGAGVGAVVLYSLFEEQVRAEQARDAALEEQHDESFAEALSYFPGVDDTERGVADAYLRHLEASASAVDVPVIASLNGASMGGWTAIARQLADAGAAALELNIYFVPGDLTMSGEAVEQRHVDIVSAVCESVRLPVAVKLSPYFSSPGNLALRLVEAGASGLVLFNRFLQPEVDVEVMAVRPSVALSSRFEGRLPRTWIAALSRHTDASLAASSGVEEASDLVRYLLVGADVVMSTSALVRHGAGYAAVLLEGLAEWMSRRGFHSLDDFRGLLAVPTDADGTSQARAGYVAALENARRTYGSLHR